MDIIFIVLAETISEEVRLFLANLLRPHILHLFLSSVRLYKIHELGQISY